MLKCLGSL